MKERAEEQDHGPKYAEGKDHGVIGTCLFLFSKRNFLDRGHLDREVAEEFSFPASVLGFQGPPYPAVVYFHGSFPLRH